MALVTVRIAVIPAHIILALPPEELEMKRSSSHLRLGALVAVLAASFQPVSLPEVQVPDRSPPLFKPMEAMVVDRRTHRLGKKKKDKFHDRHAYRKQKHVGRAPNPRFK